MNSFQIRFADILRYFILGGIEVLLFYWLAPDKAAISISAILDSSSSVSLTIVESIFKQLFSFSSSLAVAIACIFFYMLGFVTQSVMQLFLGGIFFVLALAKLQKASASGRI